MLSRQAEFSRRDAELEQTDRDLKQEELLDEISQGIGILINNNMGKIHIQYFIYYYISIYVFNLCYMAYFTNYFY